MIAGALSLASAANKWCLYFTFIGFVLFYRYYIHQPFQVFQLIDNNVLTLDY